MAAGAADLVDHIQPVVAVTTTGPATHVAFWWGDAGLASTTAVPNNGFAVVDSVMSARPADATGPATSPRSRP